MKSILKPVLAATLASLALVGTANAQHHGGGFHGGGGWHGGGPRASAWHGGGYYHGPVYRGGYYRGGWGGWGWGGAALGLGLVVATLPYAYSTYYYGGVPYYYADGTYYNSVDGGYQVVSPPAAIVQSQPVPAAQSAPAPVVYPRNNQGPQQQEADQRACNTWATSQPSAMNDASVFQRSVAACMDGRGYTVR